LANFPRTAFVLTLESPLNTSKNGVYAASILVAWDETKKDIGFPITAIENKDLQLLDKSVGLENGLKREDWKITIEKTDGGRKVKAFFNKALPFKEPLDEIKTPLIFQGIAVKNFTAYEKGGVTNILYYKNDNDFAINLLPEDRAHEIILIKTNFPFNTTLKQEIEKFENTKKDFLNNRNEKNAWKYSYQEDDKLLIPMIALHIEHNYREIENINFKAEDGEHSIYEAYQRNAFILNEQGAVVEIYSSMETDSVAGEAIEEEKPRPKILVFDKPFLLLLKKKDSPYPYFTLFIANAELLQKAQKK